MELLSLSIDSGGVWVAIDVVKEFISGWSGWAIVEERGHAIVVSSERVLILLDCF